MAISFLCILLPPLIIALIGLAFQEDRPKIAKVLYIIAGALFVISLGTCGLVMADL